MKNLLFFIVFFLSTISHDSLGQDKPEITQTEQTPKIFAVINRANWCGVCKANGERFGKNTLPYTEKGLTFIYNDITNDSTIAVSKSILKKSELFKQVYKTNRKGVGKLMQACGFIHGKNKSMVSGIVIFIDAKTLKIVKELSISLPDEEMKREIETLLNS